MYKQSIHIYIYIFIYQADPAPVIENTKVNFKKYEESELQACSSCTTNLGIFGMVEAYKSWDVNTTVFNSPPSTGMNSWDWANQPEDFHNKCSWCQSLAHGMKFQRLQKPGVYGWKLLHWVIF